MSTILENKTDADPDSAIGRYEATVIACALLSSEALDLAMAELKPDDFTDEYCQGLFRAMQELHDKGKPVDPLVLSKEKGYGFTELTKLMGDVPTTANAHYFVQQVARASLEKRALVILDRAKEKGQEGVYSALEELRNGVEKIEKIGEQILSLEKELPALVRELIDSPERPFATFSKTLNYNLNGGLQRGKVYTMMAPAGGGKTTFSLQMLEEIAREEKIPCIYVTMEQGKGELLEKTMSKLVQVNSGHIEGKYFQDQAYEDCHHLAERIIEEMMNTYKPMYAPWLYILEGSEGTSVSNIRNWVQRIRNQHSEEWKRRWKQEELENDFKAIPPAVLCIDPFQRLSSGNNEIDGSQFYKIDVVASQIKQLARDLRIPVVAISDTTKDAANKAEGTKRMGQTGVRGSYMATHTTDVQWEIRIGGEDFMDSLAKEAGEYGGKYKDLKVAHPLSDYSETYKESFPIYACVDLSKQRSGARLKAMFVYLQAYNTFIPIEIDGKTA
jgi:replicative DNA helicase